MYDKVRTTKSCRLNTPLHVVIGRGFMPGTKYDDPTHADLIL